MAVMGLRGRLVMGVVLAVWAGGILACVHGQLPVRLQPPGSDFLIIGHRGAPNRACENTLESFAQALNLGANALELDVSMTRDGELVLWHDWLSTIENDVRPTGACSLVRPPLRQPIHAVPWQEFVRDYGYEQTGQRVPVTTFAAFVSRFAHDKRVRFFFVDLKIPADMPDWVQPMFQPAVQTLRSHGVLPKTVFMTPHQDIFHQFHDQARAGNALRVSTWKSRSTRKDRRGCAWGSGRLQCTATRLPTHASPRGGSRCSLCSRHEISSPARSGGAMQSTPRVHPRRGCM